jgi:hypothetical protein
MLYPYESPHPSVDTIKNLLVESRKIPTSDGIGKFLQNLNQIVSS